MVEPVLFEFHRIHNKWRGRPVHPKGWLALLAALAAPQLGWPLKLLVPDLPMWLPYAFAMLTLGPSVWLLLRLARRRGRYIE